MNEMNDHSDLDVFTYKPYIQNRSPTPIETVQIVVLLRKKQVLFCPGV